MECVFFFSRWLLKGEIWKRTLHREKRFKYLIFRFVGSNNKKMNIFDVAQYVFCHENVEMFVNCWSYPITILHLIWLDWQLHSWNSVAFFFSLTFVHSKNLIIIKSLVRFHSNWMKCLPCENQLFSNLQSNKRTLNSVCVYLYENLIIFIRNSVGRRFSAKKNQLQRIQFEKKKTKYVEKSQEPDRRKRNSFRFNGYRNHHRYK